MPPPQRRDDGDTPFSAWFRHHVELEYGYDAEDIDGITKRYIWHKYRTGNIMLFRAERA